MECIGAMRAFIDQGYDDPWDIRSDTPGEAHSGPEISGLRIDTIEGVEPLDMQIGVFPKKTVPDALHDALFGQPEPTVAEIEAAGGDPAAVPPMQTYAILDAAKVTILPELLERSCLERRCLFKGAAYDELKNVAPWIVRLEEGNTFTRNLFTRSDAHWHLWDRSITASGAMFCRSRQSLETLQKHFRRFTQVRNQAGATIHLAFWSPQFLAAARRTTLLHREEMIMALFSCGSLITLTQSDPATSSHAEFYKMSLVSDAIDREK